jgi:hypothetical protein
VGTCIKIPNIMYQATLQPIAIRFPELRPTLSIGCDTAGHARWKKFELLRKGMRKRAVVSFLFERQIQESQSGRELWHIKGHNSTLILASEKHLKFFRKRLRERRRHLEIDQEIRESEERERQRLRDFHAEIEADIEVASASSHRADSTELPW